MKHTAAHSYIHSIVLAGLSLSALLSITACRAAAEKEAGRSLGIASVPNLRDLGGYKTKDGKTVKRGVRLQIVVAFPAEAVTYRVIAVGRLNRATIVLDR